MENAGPMTLDGVTRALLGEDSLERAAAARQVLSAGIRAGILPQRVIELAAHGMALSDIARQLETSVDATRNAAVAAASSAVAPSTHG